MTNARNVTEYNKKNKRQIVDPDDNAFLPGNAGTVSVMTGDKDY